MRRRTTWVAVVAGATLLLPAATQTVPAGAGLTFEVAAAAPPGAARPTLRMGAQGPAVRGLQERLRALRSPVAVDGRFGPQTHQAVLALQAARGLQTDGIVGPLTWQALDGGGTTLPTGGGGGTAQPVLRLGATGAPVSEAQRLLTRAGQPIAADGRFGPVTQRAVVAFQRPRGLVADGIIGPATWAALGGGTALSLVAAPRMAAQEQPWTAIGAKSWVVRRGDTLASIASATGSTAVALAAANRLPPGSRPPLGATLRVPGDWRCVVPDGGFINDFGFERAGGRTHQGNDLFAERGAPVVTPVAGRAERQDGAVGGRTVTLYGNDGHRYYFAHLEAYGADGYVAAGTMIGSVGNSGNAITTPPHLHFEIHPGGGAAINPFPTLTLACKR